MPLETRCKVIRNVETDLFLSKEVLIQRKKPRFQPPIDIFSTTLMIP